MKTKLHCLFLALALFAGLRPAAAQTARFVRISGPAATTIKALRADGSLVWSNTLAGTNYSVQTASSTPGETGWVDYVQLHVTNAINTNLLFAFNPPAGMMLVPAGFFTMGDTLDGEKRCRAHTNIDGVGVLHGCESGELWRNGRRFIIGPRTRLWLCQRRVRARRRISRCRRWTGMTR